MVRPVTYTVQPWLPRAAAMPAPAPRLAPVTTATGWVPVMVILQKGILLRIQHLADSRTAARLLRHRRVH